jgi:predicted amidophosphoribosyltransferase
MKYRPSKKLARLAGIILADSLPHVFLESNWDLVVPIPSSAKTFRKRSFHPCVELGYHVAQTLHIPLRLALVSNPKRQAQAKLHHDARLRGIKKIFTLRDPKQIRGKGILLIEDVITTGATVSAAAHCLKAAGATSVDVLALARTQVWSRFRHRVWVASGQNSPTT